MDVELEQELEMDRMESIPDPPTSDQVSFQQRNFIFRSLFILVHISIYPPSMRASTYLYPSYSRDLPTVHTQTTKDMGISHHSVAPTSATISCVNSHRPSIFFAQTATDMGGVSITARPTVTGNTRLPNYLLKRLSKFYIYYVLCFIFTSSQILKRSRNHAISD